MGPYIHRMAEPLEMILNTKYVSSTAVLLDQIFLLSIEHGLDGDCRV